MLSIISLLIIVTISILVTRVATIALTHTGLSRESARFQARSAFTGVGFTTSESEKVVNHPLRRRILLILMLVGNAGIVTAMSSLIIGFVKDPAGENLFFKIIILVLGLTFLWNIAASSRVDRILSRYIGKLLKEYTDLEIKDYAGLLHLGRDYKVHELTVEPEDWIEGKTISETALVQEGVLILGISKPNTEFIGVPRPDIPINSGDILILYGRESSVKKIDERKKGEQGNKEHFQESRVQRKVEEKQEIEIKN